MPDHSKSALTILRRKQVQARTGLPVSTMYCMMDKSSPYYDPTFPTQIRLSASSVGWIESEVEAWIESRIRASRS
jgi:prophage regulatory protein